MIQAGAFRILKSYLTVDTHNFVELCDLVGYSSDLGGYYIRQLIKDGLLEKSARGQYSITPSGKSYLAVTNNQARILPKPRLTILFIARGNDTYFTQRRTRQPYIGRLEWVAGAVQLDEPMQSAVERLQQERFGVVGQSELLGFFRRIDRLDNTNFDDKLFAVHTVNFPDPSEIIAQNSQGTILRRTLHELKTETQAARSLLDILDWSLDQRRISYVEHIYHLSPGDLA